AEMEHRRERWLVVGARDRELACAALTAAGLVVDDCAADAHRARGVDEAHETSGALRLFDAHAIAHPEEVARQLVGAGIDLTQLSVEEEDLESQFLRMVGATPGGNDNAR